MIPPPCPDLADVGSLGFAFRRLFFAGTATLIFALSSWANDVPREIALPPAPPRAVSIAAAANLVYVLEALNAAYLLQAKETKLTVATGASGNLVAQIRKGAPYDVCLSADLLYPESLITSGDAEAKSLFTFATGRLVLWTTKPGLKLTSLQAVVQDETVRKLALANPDTAPYGQAARQALTAAGVWETVQSKLVMGENITQAAQFVETGNAEAGLVALSLVLAPRLKNRGHWIAVPETTYTPIAQGAVLTRRGTNNQAAQHYLEFLRSEGARSILSQYGYLIPR